MLVDAGPLVALIHAEDRYHKRCAETFRALDQPLATVWQAFTEAMYLLGFSWRAQDALWQLVEREAVAFIPLEGRDHRRARELMRKYRDLPMDLADAALVAVAERERASRIFTLDRRDFNLYRPAGIGRFQVLPADRESPGRIALRSKGSIETAAPPRSTSDKDRSARLLSPRIVGAACHRAQSAARCREVAAACQPATYLSPGA